MRKVLTVIRKEYLERVRSKSFVIGTVLGPALMSMFILVPVLVADKGGDEDRTVGVIDLSGEVLDPLTAALVDKGVDYVELEPLDCGARDREACVEELRGMILDGTVHSGVVVGERRGLYQHGVRARTIEGPEKVTWPRSSVVPEMAGSSSTTVTSGKGAP